VRNPKNIKRSLNYMNNKHIQNTATISIAGKNNRNIGMNRNNAIKNLNRHQIKSNI